MEPLNYQGLIPQADPFVLVDKLIEYNEIKVVSTFVVPEQHYLVSSGTLTAYGLMENMAQTAAMMSGYESKIKGEAPPIGFIGSIEQGKIVHLPTVGSELVTTLQLQTKIMNVLVVTAEVKLEDEIQASCKMKIVIMDQL